MTGARVGRCDLCGVEVPAGAAWCGPCRAEVDRPRAAPIPPPVAPAAAIPPPPPVPPRKRSIIGPVLIGVLTVLVVGAVGAGMIAVSVVRVEEDAEQLEAERRRSSPGGEGETTPAAGGEPGGAPDPMALDRACVTRADGQEITSRPEQPPPVPGQPGQRVLLIDGTTVHGNLDLAPDGGWEAGHSPASDATTVFVACILPGDSQPTGETCDYLPDDGGPMWSVALHVPTSVVVVTEARTATEVGRSAPIPATDEGCPMFAFAEGDGTITGDGEVDVLLAIAWLRDHLTGAVYTP